MGVHNGSRPVLRSAPPVPLSPCPPDYARYLGEGWDSVQEAYNVKHSGALTSMLEAAQAEARRASARGGGLAALRLGETDYRVWAGAPRGYRWVLECEGWEIFIAAPGTNWPMSIRYLSHAIWREGSSVPLRDAALRSLHSHITQIDDDKIRLSRADYCFDFYSPAFTAEHKPGALAANFVCHSSCKHDGRGKVGRIDDNGHFIGRGPRGHPSW